MAITKKDARQQVVFAEVDFTFEDLATGVLAEAVDVPAGAIVVGGYLAIDTGWDSSSSDTFTVGDSVDDDEYAAGVNGQAAARTALTITGYEYGAASAIGIMWTGSGDAPAQGAGRLFVEYISTNRAQFTQG